MKLIITLLTILFNLNLFFASSYKLIQKEIKDENKSKNYNISVYYHQMEGFRDKSIQDDFNKYVYDIVNNAVQDFRKEMKGWTSKSEYPSEFDIGDTIFLQDDNLISIRLDGYEFFSGAAHPTTFFYTVNFNLNDDEPLKLSNLFKNDYLMKVSDLCIEDLIRQKNEYSDNPDVSWIKEGASPKEENFEVFNILESSLLITFPVYQVASYAEGPKEVNIPYTKILNIIDKKGPIGYLLK